MRGSMGCFITAKDDRSSNPSKALLAAAYHLNVDVINHIQRSNDSID